MANEIYEKIIQVVGKDILLPVLAEQLDALVQKSRAHIASGYDMQNLQIERGRYPTVPGNKKPSLLRKIGEKALLRLSEILKEYHTSKPTKSEKKDLQASPTSQIVQKPEQQATTIPSGGVTLIFNINTK